MTNKTTLYASAQYNDLTGNVAVDQENLFSVYLEKSGLKTSDEFMVGLSFNKGPSLPTEEAKLCGTAYVVKSKNFEEAQELMLAGSLKVRKVEFDLTATEMLKHFKRFSMMLIPKGFDLLGKDIITD